VSCGQSWPFRGLYSAQVNETIGSEKQQLVKCWERKESYTIGVTSIEERSTRSEHTNGNLWPQKCQLCNLFLSHYCITCDFSKLSESRHEDPCTNFL
jgi:hypothetical protein